MEENYKNLLNKYPFLTFVSYGKTEYIGIIQNHDDSITTIYDFGCLKTTEEKLLFIKLAEEWWWESSRQIPINIFLKNDWTLFKETLKTLNSKDVTIKHGPTTSLKQLSAKKSKKKNITLLSTGK